MIFVLSLALLTREFEDLIFIYITHVETSLKDYAAAECAYLFQETSNYSYVIDTQPTFRDSLLRITSQLDLVFDYFELGTEGFRFHHSGAPNGLAISSKPSTGLRTVMVGPRKTTRPSFRVCGSGTKVSQREAR